MKCNTQQFIRNYSKYLKTFNLPEDSGGINIGDQKAIYFLTKLYTPTRILELGTHIGCSTINFLIASKKNQNFESLTTVDIVDLNNEKISKTSVDGILSTNSKLFNVEIEHFNKFVLEIQADMQMLI